MDSEGIEVLKSGQMTEKIKKSMNIKMEQFCSSWEWEIKNLDKCDDAKV